MSWSSSGTFNCDTNVTISGRVTSCATPELDVRTVLNIISRMEAPVVAPERSTDHQELPLSFVTITSRFWRDSVSVGVGLSGVMGEGEDAEVLKLGEDLSELEPDDGMCLDCGTTLC